MRTNLYLFALAGLLGLSACQRQATGSFLPSHSEVFARTTPKTTTTTAVENMGIVPMAPFVETKAVVQPEMEAATPAAELVVSAADNLVVATKGTHHEARAQRLKAALSYAPVREQFSTAPRKLNFAEKMVTKMVTRKVNRKLAEARHGEATQRVDSNIKLGIVFLAVALILVLISQPLWGSIAAVIGLVFLILGLINQAGG